MASSPKSTKDEKEKTNKELAETEAPDGGWGWVVVGGAVILNFLIGGAVNTFGVLYVALLDIFQQDASTTAWVGSMANAMGLLLGPMSSALSSRFSCRTMVFVGGVITSLGWFTTGFMPRLEYMFITYGLMAGIGKSMAYTPSIVMVGQWFDKRRSLANGLSVAGAGIGTFAFAPLLEYLLAEYSFQETMMIMSAVMLHICICGSLFRPVPRSKKDKIESVRVEQTGSGNLVPVVQNDKKGNENGGLDVCSDSVQGGFKGNVFHITSNSAKGVHTQNGHSAICGANANIDATTDTKDYNIAIESTPKAMDKNSKTSAEDQNKEKRSLKDYLDYTLVKDPRFLCFGISVMLATLGHSPASVMLPALARQYHVEPGKAAFLLSITGITDIIGRLTFGVICDIKFLKENRKYLYVCSIFISGIANITCGFASEYWHFATYSVIFGMFAGSYNALTPVILVDLLGADKLSSSFGLALLFQGIGFLVGPPIAGLMKDSFESYQSAFYFAGVAMVLSSLVINLSNLCTSRQTFKLQDGSVNPAFNKENEDIETAGS